MLCVPSDGTMMLCIRALCSSSCVSFKVGGIFWGSSSIKIFIYSLIHVIERLEKH